MTMCRQAQRTKDPQAGSEHSEEVTTVAEKKISPKAPEGGSSKAEKTAAARVTKKRLSRKRLSRKRLAK